MGFYRAAPEVVSLIKKLIAVIKSNTEARELYINYSGDCQLELLSRQFENAVGNRLFILKPKAFGINEQEGRILRVYFQEACGDEIFTEYIQGIIESVAG